MDCDFLEIDFYYSAQPRTQGETSYDSLGWLDISDYLDNTFIATPKVSPATIEADVSVPLLGPPSDDVQQEVSESVLSTDILVRIDNNVTNPEVPGESIYVLPNRSTRGIPLARYSPERVSRTSRYPMGDTVRGSV